VRLSSTRIAPGEIVTIRSVVVNRGASAIEVTHDACAEIELSGVLKLASQRVCVVGILTRPIAPGDSLVANREARLEPGTAPGRYAVRVQQLIKPPLAATLEIVAGRG